MKKHIFIAVVILFLGLGLMAYAGTRLQEAEQVYKEGDESYERLREQLSIEVSNEDPKEEKETDTSEDPLPEQEPQEPNTEIPPLSIDLDLLKKLNGDAVAWLYCPDTVIDYPVMKADDYSYYLNHLPDGKMNANGSLFIDYNNAADFRDPLTVIYGHHMKSGKMFGSLVGYKKQSYYDEHPHMYLYTRQGNYRIDLIYGSVIDARQWRSRAFMYAENLSSLMSYAAHATTFKSDVRYKAGDRVVVMTTCSYEFDDARYMVLGILVPV